MASGPTPLARRRCSPSSRPNPNPNPTLTLTLTLTLTVTLTLTLTLTLTSLLNITFSGLRSRCTIRSACLRGKAAAA